MNLSDQAYTDENSHIHWDGRCHRRRHSAAEPPPSWLQVLHTAHDQIVPYYCSVLMLLVV